MGDLRSASKIITHIATIRNDMLNSIATTTSIHREAPGGIATPDTIIIARALQKPASCAPTQFE
jgi:hypothetical protein